MTTFDELIGAEPNGTERDRLRGVHELLLEAGPPPELSPEMEAGPTLGMSLSRTRSAYARRRRTVLLTAAAAAAVALVIGLGAGAKGHGTKYPSFAMNGTVFAPDASGTLDYLPPKGSKPRLKLEVKGLPAQAQPYVVYLVRGGRPVAQCGVLKVSTANRDVTKVFISPYPLQGSDTWIVTEPSADGGDTPGPTVLQQKA